MSCDDIEQTGTINYETCGFDQMLHYTGRLTGQQLPMHLNTSLNL